MTSCRILCVGVLTVASLAAQNAKDPGVRGGAPGAGGIVSGLGSDGDTLFAFLTSEFTQLHSVGGTVGNETGNGLGPGYNANGCGVCHSFPAIGGTSPAINPQVAQATLDGARNSIPSFITHNGPVREARFVRNPDGSADGSVHNLFTIKGRVDAPGCMSIQQPDFAGNLAAGNVIFRIPTPMFGAGLIENISEATILANKNASGILKAALGISGRENRNGNDGTITRFGWKAQNKSLTMFSGEAYNVEMGVTNDLFSTERNMTQDCNFNTQPEDHVVYGSDIPDGGGTSGMQHFATFGRLLAPPTPAPSTPSTTRGSATFVAIGCGLCHTPTLRSDKSDVPSLNQQAANLYSDLLLHNMGTGLADGVSQGLASGNEFRSAPLWGVGQRIFFLHDGRTSDLLQAILAHASPGSEANAVIVGFQLLSELQKQDLLNFLRSL
jgi:CxxC motif-containing protein (DUF1111 family)